MPAKSVIGIDLGTRKSGVCWVSGNDIVRLQTFETETLIATLTQLEQQDQCPTALVVDAPIDRRCRIPSNRPSIYARSVQ
jgi:molecular chaperone DnaK (HSP70)